jgi:mxaA protein
MRRAALLAVALMLPSPASTAAAPAYRVSAQMRDTGYVLGDLLTQRIDVQVPDGARLDADSVPRLGRVNNWLGLRDARVDHHRQGYTLLLTYQMFGAVESALQLAIPEFQLRFSDAATVRVAPQPFYLSPVLPATLEDADRQPRATPAPEPMPRSLWRASAAASLAAALLLALYLAWIYDRLPWSPRKPGPLTALFRGLRRRRTASLDAQAYRDLLRQLHAALNHCAGQTLYLDNLPLLFERAPHLQPLRSEIESLFRHSRQVFYDAAPAAGDWPAAQIVELCRQARDCERGVR